MRVLLVAAVLLAGTAEAQTSQTQTPNNLLVTDLSVTSDYRFEGLSNSDRHAAVQGSFYLWRPDNLFAGAFVSGVDNGASYEVDLYGGRKFDLGKTRLTLQGMAALFPDKKDNGVPTYDFLQASAKLERKLGAVALNGGLNFSPKASAGAGRAWSFYAGADVPATGWLSFGAKVGMRDSQRGVDRSYWDAGMTLSHGDLSLDLRYFGTDLSRNECFFTDWCEPGLVSKLTWRLPMTVLN